MLHALNFNKANVRSLFNVGHRVPFEDLITSSIFGPLEFMGLADRAAIISALLKELSIPLHCTPTPPIKIEFWKQVPVRSSSRLSTVEWDITIEFGADSRLLIEVKWGAYLSKDQLADQWSSITGSRENCYHLLLVRDQNRYRADIKENIKTLRSSSDRRLYASKLKDLSWARLGELLQCLAADKAQSAQIRAWATHASKLLVREEFRIMQGWSQIGLRKVLPLKWKLRSVNDGL